MTVDRDVTRPRPNPLQPYHCGHAEPFAFCPTGPTAEGQCCKLPPGNCDQADSDHTCSSFRQASAADPSLPGLENRCQLPTCTPTRSYWHWRTKLALNLAILASGILLACISLPNHERFFVAGELSRSHSQILENTLVSDRCSLCHPTAHGSSVGQTQQQLCMNCHNSHMPDALVGNPHDLTSQQFNSLISFRNASSDRQLQQPAERSATQCASCHIEHHGSDRDLKAMADTRCQACHQQKFASFSSNHPEFRSFPYDTTRRIAFDHAAHAEKYFNQKNSDFDCKQCHEVDSAKRSHIGRTASFEKACASCHAQPLYASSADGWAILQLPSLNAADVALGGPPLANWPIAALYGYDGKISLPMRLLLSGDTDVAAALHQFAQGDLSQVQPGNPAQQAAARTVAIAVRQLLRDSAELGQEAWKQRLTLVASGALDRGLSEAEAQLVRSMVTGLPPDLFRQIEHVWFGSGSGITNRRQPRLSANLVKTQDLLIDEDSKASTESAEELLRGSSTQDIMSKPSSKPNNAPGTLNTDDDGDMSVDELFSLPAAKPNGSNRSKASKVDQSGGMRITTKSIGEGGWYLDSQLLTLKYMPQGHADPVVAAWIQFAALIDSARQPASSVPTESADLKAWHWTDWKPGSEAVGGCTECHLLPDYDSHELTMNDWRCETKTTIKPFTKFNHKPHITLAVTADCKHCHQLNQSLESRYAEVIKSLAEQSQRLVHHQAAQRHFRCEFKPMEKSQCNACHREGGASEACTQCHNYHIGSSGLEMIQAIENAPSNR